MRTTATRFIDRGASEIEVTVHGEVTFGYRPRVDDFEVVGDVELTADETERARQALIDAASEDSPEVARADWEHDRARDDAWSAR
jgi:hypothetical protein